MSRPLPLSILTRTVTYYEPDKSSRYEGAFKTPVTINNVFLMYKKYVKKQNPGNQDKEVQGQMFLDATGTNPFFEPVYGAKVTAENGDEFTINGVKPVYYFTQLHHYEVDLI
jgi:hypothetical protein